MSNLTLVAKALTKGKPLDALAKKTIRPGDHPLHGRAIVQIDCVVRKQEDTEASPPYKPDWLRVLAFLHGSDSCGDLAQKFHTALTRADNPKTPISASHLEHLEASLECFRAAKQEKTPKVPREGACTVVGEVTLIEFEKAA